MSNRLITIRTIRDLLENNHGLALNCVPCKRWVVLDLEQWIRDGRGDTNYVGARFRCERCGGIADKQVRSSPTGAVANHGTSVGCAD